MRTSLLAAVLAVGLFASPAPAQSQDYSWRWYTTPPVTNLYLYRGGVQVGHYSLETDAYTPLLDPARPSLPASWGAAGALPHPLPANFAGRRNFGVDTARLGQAADKDRYKVHTKDGATKEVSKDEALRLVREGVPDDSKKLRLTVIGSDQERAGVLADLERPEFKDVKDQVNVWAVPADHWSLKDNTTGQPLFQTSGHPTVYLQAPGGKVLHRQDGYRPGDIAAVRKAAPSYDPKKDPNLHSPLAGALAGPVPLLAGGTLALVGLAWAGRRRLGMPV